jgi:hypothetical protein
MQYRTRTLDILFSELVFELFRYIFIARIYSSTQNVLPHNNMICLYIQIPGAYCIIAEMFLFLGSKVWGQCIFVHVFLKHREQIDN